MKVLCLKFPGMYHVNRPRKLRNAQMNEYYIHFNAERKTSIQGF
mgnify:CR=1 FL=1